MAGIYANETLLRKTVLSISSEALMWKQIVSVAWGSSLFLQRVVREERAVGENGHLEEAESTKKGT